MMPKVSTEIPQPGLDNTQEEHATQGAAQEAAQAAIPDKDLNDMQEAAQIALPEDLGDAQEAIEIPRVATDNAQEEQVAPEAAQEAAGEEVSAERPASTIDPGIVSAPLSPRPMSSAHANSRQARREKSSSAKTRQEEEKVVVVV